MQLVVVLRMAQPMALESWQLLGLVRKMDDIPDALACLREELHLSTVDPAGPRESGATCRFRLISRVVPRLLKEERPGAPRAVLPRG